MSMRFKGEGVEDEREMSWSLVVVLPTPGVPVIMILGRVRIAAVIKRLGECREHESLQITLK